MNKVTLIGRVTAAPETRNTQEGKSVCTFSLAVNRQKRKGQEKADVDFITIVAWEKLAEICSKYLDKGKQIAIDGRLQTRTYTANDGQKRKVYEVRANEMEMLGSKRDQADASSSSSPAQDPDDVSMSDLGMDTEVPF